MKATSVTALLLSGIAFGPLGCSRPGPATPTAASVARSEAAEPTTSVGADSADAPTAAVTAQFAVTGSRAAHACLPADGGVWTWNLAMADAGPRPLRIVALTHHDDRAGCEATVNRPRSRVVVDGPTMFAPRASGQSSLAFDSGQFRCGRVQVDVSLVDDAGNDTLIVGAVVDYGTPCAPSTPLTCSMRNTLNYAPPGIPAAFVATGGDGTYLWSTPNGTPASGSGSSFTTNYWRSGNFTASVSSGDQVTTCDVVAVPLTTCNQCLLSACQPYYQYVGVHRPVTFSGLTASTGEATFTWRAPGGTPASGTAAAGSSFTTTFAQEGYYQLEVATSQRTWACIVSVVPPGFAP